MTWSILPIEHHTYIYLIVNFKTAKAIDLTILEHFFLHLFTREKHSLGCSF